MKKLVLVLSVCLLSLASQARDFKIVSQEFMPIAGTGPDGKMAGVQYEIAKEMCEKLKFNCLFELTPLSRGLEMIKTGEAQMMLALAKIPERESTANFPGMVTQVGYTFFVKKGQASKFTKLEDFKGKSVAATTASATYKSLVEQNKKIGDLIKIVDEATSETPLRKLSGDRYPADSAAYGPRAVGLYQAKKESLNVEPVAFDAFLQSHSMPVSKVGVTSEELEKIRKAIHEVMKTEKIKKLVTENGLLVHPEQK